MARGAARRAAGVLGGHRARVSERLREQRAGGRDVALRQPQQRQPGLRVPAVLVRGEERLLGPGQVAGAQPDGAELGEGPAELAAHPRPQLPAGGHGLPLRLGARSPEAEHLGAVHAAATVEPAVGSTRAPQVHRLGPLLGAVVLGQPLQGADDLAVHHPDGQGIELAGHHAHRGLVQEFEPVVDLAVEDHQPGGRHPAQGGGHRDPLAGAEVDRLPRPAAGAVGVAAENRS